MPRKLQNDPRSAQQPPPRYANDPSGFWTRNAKQDAQNWQGLGIAAPDVDRFELAAILKRSINWMKIDVRWGEVTFPASLDDGQISAPLELGGLGVQGSITIVFSKSSFPGNQWPMQQDDVQISVRGEMKTFQIVSVSEGFDMGDDALVAILSPEDAE